MEFDELAGQIVNQYKSIDARLICLDDKVTDTHDRVIKIESTMQTKDVCEERRAAMREKMNKKRFANKVMAFLGGIVGGIIAVVTFKFFTGGE